MVSQEFSKEPTFSILRQCLNSEMDACPVHSEDICYGLQFQSTSVPFNFHPLGEQISRPEDNEMVTRALMNRETPRENMHRGFSYRHGHGLSLTLGSRLPSDVQKDRQPNVVPSNYLSNDYITCEGETNSSVYNPANLSNFYLHGMASIVATLQNSPFMKPVQQLLDEVVCVSNAAERGSGKLVRRPVGMVVRNGERSVHAGGADWNEVNDCSSEEKHMIQLRITKLTALLDELESRYEHYFHEMDRIMSSFEVVAGIGAAASYTALTIQAMTKHFSNLRDSIIIQLNASRDSLSDNQIRNDGGLSHQKVLDRNSRQKTETLQHLGMIQIRQVWRPLRGLPEDSVSLLRAWLFEHFLHPYPSDNEKLVLASQTGLSRNQISNWFINARVRLWKPMIEEMYREEIAEDLQDANSS